jgi:cation:H+ antiporter
MNNYFLSLVGIVFGVTLLTILTAVLANYILKVAKYYKVADYIIIIFLLGIVNSIGDFSLALVSQFLRFGELIAANAIGVTIALTLLVGGVTAIYERKLPTVSLRNNKLLIALNAIVLIFILLVSDMNISRVDGVILVSVFALYLAQISTLHGHLKLRTFNPLHSRKQLYVAIVLIVFLVMNIALTSGFAIQQVYAFNNVSSLGLFIVGIALISPLSVLPELFYELKSVDNGGKQVALSDLVTECIANLSLIVGICAIIQPITLVSEQVVSFNLFALAVVLIFFNIYAYTGRKIDRKEGIIMLLIYFIYLFVNYQLFIYPV